VGLHVTYKMGFGFDDWIYCTLYIHNSELQVIQRHRWTTHTSQFTVAHALCFSAFASRILPTDLSQSHCHFKSHMKSSLYSLIPFLPLFCTCQFWRLDSIQFLCSQAHIRACWRPETRLLLLLLLLLLFCAAEYFCVITLHGPHGKRRLLLSRRLVYWPAA
jgi:hypothetical protein